MQVSVFPSSLKPSCFTIDAVMLVFVIPTHEESHQTSISVPVFTITILLQELPASMHLSFRRRRNHIIRISVYPSSLKPSCFTIDAVMVVCVIPTQEESHHISISLPVFIKTILLHKLPASMYLSFRRRRNHIIRVSVFPSSLKPSSFTSYWRSCLYLSFRRRRNHIIPVSIFPSSLKPFSFTSYRQTCICHSDAVWITSY